MASLVKNELEHWKCTITSMVRFAAMQEVAVLYSLNHYCFSINLLGIIYLINKFEVVQKQNIQVSTFRQWTDT